MRTTTRPSVWAPIQQSPSASSMMSLLGRTPTTRPRLTMATKLSPAPQLGEQELDDTEDPLGGRDRRRDAAGETLEVRRKWLRATTTTRSGRQDDGDEMDGADAAAAPDSHYDGATQVFIPPDEDVDEGRRRRQLRRRRRRRRQRRRRRRQLWRRIKWRRRRQWRRPRRRWRRRRRRRRRRRSRHQAGNCRERPHHAKTPPPTWLRQGRAVWPLLRPAQQCRRRQWQLPLASLQVSRTHHPYPGSGTPMCPCPCPLWPADTPPDPTARHRRLTTARVAAGARATVRSAA